MMAHSIGISQTEAKHALALQAHLRQLYRAATFEDRPLRPIEMDHADLLMCAASFRALLFDDTGKPILLSFAERHGIDIRVETLETTLGLFLLSFYAPHDLHVSDFLADILLNPETRSRYPLDEVQETLVAFVDGSGFEGPLSRSDLWTVPIDEDDGSSLSIANKAPVQWAHITRRRVPISEWGNVRIGYLKKRPIPRRSLITYVANKLGGVHYDSARLPPDLSDAEDHRVLATAYDWDNQAIMHAGLVMVGLACLEILRAPGVLPLLAALEKHHQQRQERLMQGDRHLPDR
jgi:hypothetical protein